MPRQIPNNRHLGRDAGAHRRQHGRVAFGIDRLVVGEGRAVVVVGLDVRAPAGEHESVDALDEGLDVEPLASAGSMTGTQPVKRSTASMFFAAVAWTG